MRKYFEFSTCEFVACMIVSFALTLISSDARSATQSEIIQSCESCHGTGGNGQVTSTPRLNGLQPEYIAARLKKLSDTTRTNPHAHVAMVEVLSAESDADRESIAIYFASQPPTAPKPGARAAEGKEIYENGLKAENVIACNQCHGAQGEGHDGSPRLAGQHADYLKAQLMLFNLNFRQHGKTETVTSSRFAFLGASPAYRAPMNANAKTMSQNTMDALASYLGND
jgi:cytochrome c553